MDERDAPPSSPAQAPHPAFDERPTLRERLARLFRRTPPARVLDEHRVLAWRVWDDAARAWIERAFASARARGHARVDPLHMLTSLEVVAESVDTRLADEETSVGAPVAGAALSRLLERAIWKARDGSAIVSASHLAAALLEHDDALALLRAHGVTRDALVEHVLGGRADDAARPLQPLPREATPEGPAGERLAIVMHNDDVTPQDLVVDLLHFVFGFDDEEATALMWSVHETGSALVDVYDREEARTLAATALDFARDRGAPLRVTLEVPPPDADAAPPV